jgi:ATP-dependent RNA helicase DeaD
VLRRVQSQEDGEGSTPRSFQRFILSAAHFPQLHSRMQKKPFSELGLSPELLKAVDRMGFEETSPIQTEAIPPLLTGRDVVGQSQTGSGKTAAFAIPAIEKVDSALRAPQVIILCPTRELAMQVAEEVAKLAFFKRGVRELPIYGGASYERQFRGLQAGAQIIIGTPGRVIDHLERGSLRLDAVRMVILDECDRMLDMGFSEDIEKILAQAPPERQSVFFSATLPAPIRRLIERFSKEPQHIRIEAQTVDAPTIDQVYYEVGRGSKIEVLCRLIDFQEINYAIIFCATKMMVDELTEQLSARGYAADKLHGDMAQTMRERVMRRFREKKVEFLVATDVAARGLDVENVEVVFNYDLPNDAEDYVHRIGRTGRAGKSGRAISFVAGREIYKMQGIMRFTKGRIRREQVPTASAVEEKRATAIYDTLRETLEKAEFRRHDEFVDRLLEEGHTPSDIASGLLHLLAGEKSRPVERIPEDSPRPQGGGGHGERRDYPRYEPVRGGRPAAGPGPARERRPFPQKEHLPSGPASARPRAAAAENYRARRGDEGDGPQGGHGRFVREESGMFRIRLNTGSEHGVGPGDVFGVIAGAASLPREAIGAIRVQPRHTFVEVREEMAEHVLRRLAAIRFKGRKLIAVPASGAQGDADEEGGPRSRPRPRREQTE